MKHADSGLQYIVKCYDEQTKNHQLDVSDLQTACMVETPESKFCPVTSFLKYKSHLSPLMEEFWQTAKTKNWKDCEVWYQNKKVGNNTLSTFMSNLSHDADLSRMYTNHSIRVTGTTYLTRKQFSPKQIMSITGHKSLNSLAIYQKVSTDEKLSMAYAMSCYLENDKSRPLVLGPTPAIHQNPEKLHQIEKTGRPVTSTITKAHDAVLSETVPKPQNQIVAYESEDPFQDTDIPDFDLAQIMETIEKENTIMMHNSTEGSSMKTTMQQRQVVQRKSPQIPIFNNCKIGSINITINKN